MILKLTSDTNCSVENALVWAISAKNALHNNFGYCPDQLVFGRNPNLRSVLTAKPPALRTTTTCQLIADHLNVYYKRNCSKAWCGPAVILGVDSNLAIVRHGGSHLRASPCHLRKVKDDSQTVGTPVKPSIIMKDCDTYKSGQNKQLDFSSDTAVTIDADEPINADEIPNDH